MAAYDDTLNVLKQYLGPAAPKFLDRQLGRLAITKDELTSGHMGQLASACRTSAALVIDDAKAAEIEKKIQAIG